MSDGVGKEVLMFKASDAENIMKHKNLNKAISDIATKVHHVS